ncbi:hypothetical protein Naga_100245g1, partial [Nannochloropsis gaditana]
SLPPSRPSFLSPPFPFSFCPRLHLSLLPSLPPFFVRSLSSFGRHLTPYSFICDNLVEGADSRDAGPPLRFPLLTPAPPSAPPTPPLRHLLQGLKVAPGRQSKEARRPETGERRDRALMSAVPFSWPLSLLQLANPRLHTPPSFSPLSTRLSPLLGGQAREGARGKRSQSQPSSRTRWGRRAGEESICPVESFLH